MTHFYHRRFLEVLHSLTAQTLLLVKMLVGEVDLRLRTTLRLVLRVPHLREQPGLELAEPSLLAQS